MTEHTAIDGEEAISNPGEKQGPNKLAVTAFFLFFMLVMLGMGYFFFATDSTEPVASTTNEPESPKTVALPETVKSTTQAEAKQFGFTTPENPFYQPEPEANQRPAYTPKPAIIRIDKSRSPLSEKQNGAANDVLGLPQGDTAINSAMDFYKQQLSTIGQGGQGTPPSNQAPSLQDSLSGTETPQAMAHVLAHRNVLLTKGTFIDCVLNTAINSSVAGMTKCTLTRNIYSDNGNTLLLERGSIVTGEYRANLAAGQARLFVLWDRVKTPHGVVVDLSSPSTDPLGASGMPGDIETHFWQRYGGAMMLSLVDDLAASATSSSGGSTVTLQNSSQAAQNAATEALKNTINIPPTLRKNQGERINIFVARDIDFSNVYRLRLTQ